MNNNLLAKEKEFQRLNKEIEEKTRELMKEVDFLMKSTDDNGDYSNLLPTTVTQTHSLEIIQDIDEGNLKTSSPIENQLELFNLKRIIDAPTLMERGQSESLNFVKDNFKLPLSKESMNIKDFIDSKLSIDKNQNKVSTIIQLLKTKIKSQEDEIRAAQNECKKKSDNIKTLEMENKKQLEAREILKNQVSSLKESLVKVERENEDCQMKIQEQNVEISALKKEIENRKREIKSNLQQNTNIELRLNRSLEENEKLKSCIKFLKLDEKELREQIRRIESERRLSIKSLEKQKSELFQAYKKQTYLIDNLKKQKVFK